jgi:acetyl-CoA acetyltransferase
MNGIEFLTELRQDERVSGGYGAAGHLLASSGIPLCVTALLNRQLARNYRAVTHAHAVLQVWCINR